MWDRSWFAIAALMSIKRGLGFKVQDQKHNLSNEDCQRTIISRFLNKTRDLPNTIMNDTQQTAVTQYITVNGDELAYRTLGPSIGIPLVMLIHFRGNMDWWDPRLINRLATRRRVLLLDNSGVGHSTGPVGVTYSSWAATVISLLAALAIPEVDLFGFSMGGYAAQMVALNAPKGLIHKLILAGTGPSANPDFVASEAGPVNAFATASTYAEIEAATAVGLFTNDTLGKVAAAESWKRVNERQVDRKPFLDANGTARQLEALAAWTKPGNDPNNSFARLHELKIPVFIAGGAHDIFCPVANTWTLFQNIRTATLHVFPDSGHGFLYQYADLFVEYIDRFLEM